MISFMLVNLPLYGQDISEKNIRIGLYFDKTARQNYFLSSSSGFNLFQKENNDFKIIAEIDYVNIEAALQNGKLVFLNSKQFIPNLNFALSFEKPVYIASKSEFISIEGKRYRGYIGFLPDFSQKGMTVINELKLEEYLYGVVPLEMPPSWPMEALKAQAVAARTYAVYNLNKWGKYGFDLTSTTLDQVYGGVDCENPRTTQAVDLTQGELLYYQDRPILAYFHSNSGGFIENFSEWYFQDLPYLKAKEDTFSAEAPDLTWEKNLSFEELESILKSAGFDLGNVIDFIVVEKSSTGRVKKVLIRGTKGEKTFTANEIRNLLSLKSTLFEVDAKKPVYVVSKSGNFSLISFSGPIFIESRFGKNHFTSFSNIFMIGRDAIKKVDISSGIKIIGRGWGHGIGMSQWGAKIMAEKGYNYKDILSFYYSNVDIRR